MHNLKQMQHVEIFIFPFKKFFFFFIIITDDISGHLVETDYILLPFQYRPFLR